MHNFSSHKSSPRRPPKERCLNSAKHNTKEQHKSHASCRNRLNSFIPTLCVGSVAHLRSPVPLLAPHAAPKDSARDIVGSTSLEPTDYVTKEVAPEDSALGAEDHCSPESTGCAADGVAVMGGGGTTTGPDTTPPHLSVKTGGWGGAVLGGGVQPRGGRACARPTTTTCIPPGGMCVGGFGGTEVCM